MPSPDKMPPIPSNTTIALFSVGLGLVIVGCALSVFVLGLGAVSLMTFSPLVLSHGFQAVWAFAYSFGFGLLLLSVREWDRDGKLWAEWRARTNPESIPVEGTFPTDRAAR